MTRRGVGETPEDTLDLREDTLLTRKEAGALLKVSQATLSRWARTGEGPPLTWISPNTSRYLRSDIERHLRNNRRG